MRSLDSPVSLPVPAHPGRLRSCLLALLLLATVGCGDGYPPPLLAGTAPPKIRVRLGKPRAKTTLRIPDASWTIRSTRGSAYASRGKHALRTVLAVGTTGVIVRGRDSGATVLRVRPASTFTLGDRTYRGTLIVRREGARLVFVNELDLETYVSGVIANEVGPNAEPATYRAQAVTARTYAWMKLSRSGAANRAFHVYDSAASQVYTGLTVPPAYGIRYADMVVRARETRGVVLTWRGRPFHTYYASTCGGHTTNPESSGLDPGRGREPLRGVPCRHCTTSKYFSWKKTVSDDDVIAGLKSRRLPVSRPLHAIRVTRRGRGGWVAKFEVQHGPKKSTRAVPGHVFRSALRLRSHNVQSVRRVRGGWVIDGRGWGHGVGMCQWGAIEMGRKGATETEILRYYYPGIEFTKVY